ncbi:polysaccharide biosynthesis protein [Thiobacter aerophilum]|uniref:Nucleoside-diphosphate sugar epimerase/dehydratase n=1 Tax=Thiobacter aerophilum TaxID=3121275 RepID=A0ABV0EFB8_9BURK
MRFFRLGNPLLPWRHPRAALAFAHDLVAAGVAWWLAFWLRFSPDWPEQFQHLMEQGLPWVVLVQGGCFIGFGLYRGMWRFASLPDLKRILLAVAVAALVAPATLLLLAPGVVLPRSVLLLDPLLLAMIMGGSRLAYRAFKEHRLAALAHPERRPALILGAGSAADFFLRELRRHPSGLRPVGLLDDNRAKQGRRLQDVPVLGALDDLPRLAQRMGAELAVLAMPAAPHAVKRRAAELALKAGVELLTLPALEDLLAGRVTIQSLRGLELEDLLGRDPVTLDLEGLTHAIGGRTVMVTGGAGSIGSELVRQLAAFRPARLVLVDASEYGLYRMGEECAQRFPDLAVELVAADVRDGARMTALLAHWRPVWVYHAAAYKHVPLMEQDNALECLKNNVLGTWVTARAAIAAAVEKFVLVSTDKAVNPTNVMGASKRLAELVCQSLEGQGTHFLSVRFGNVLGSSGSVVPKFRAQIEAGGPVTVTHPEVVRYFMTIPEAAQLVLQAGLMGRGGEIFVLDMGEPVKIVDLARLMIRLAGRTEADIPIVFTGLRPGEKLYEELLADAEATLPTPHPRVRVAKAAGEYGCVDAALAWIQATTDAGPETVRVQLAQWLRDYRPERMGAAAASAGVVQRAHTRA